MTPTSAELSALRLLFRAETPRRLIRADVADSLVSKRWAVHGALVAHVSGERHQVPTLRLTAEGRRALSGISGA